MAQQCGTLFLTPIKGENLANIHRISQQSPYVQFTVLPWKSEAVQSKALHGSDPVWVDEGADHVPDQIRKHQRVLQYVGHPPEGLEPELLVQVLENELARTDRVVGKVHVNLRQYLRAPRVKHRVRVELLNEREDSVGTVEFFLEFKFVGALVLRVVNATNLTNLHRIRDQNPFVKVTLEPNGTSEASSTAKGLNPSWEGKKKDTLLLRYNGDFPVEDLHFNVEVFDAELLGQQRLIGSKRFTVGQYVTGEGKERRKGLAIELLDGDGAVAGNLNCLVSFVNDAYDGTLDVASNIVKDVLPKGMSLRDLQNKETLQKSLRDANFGLLLSHVIDLGTLFIHELSNSQVFVDIEKNTGIPRFMAASVFAAFCAFFLLFAWTSFGTKLVCIIIGTLYPGWMSYKALESVAKEDDTKWLTYWLIYGLSNLMEESVLLIVVEMRPSLYFFCKMLFLMWLVHPVTDGADIMYRRLLAPFLRSHESEIAATIRLAREHAFTHTSD